MARIYYRLTVPFPRLTSIPNIGRGKATQYMPLVLTGRLTGHVDISVHGVTAEHVVYGMDIQAYLVIQE